MKQHSFDKFINKEKNSKKKEAFRQEKRKWKKERNKKYEDQAKKFEPRNEKVRAGFTETSNYKKDKPKITGEYTSSSFKQQASRTHIEKNNASKRNTKQSGKHEADNGRRNTENYKRVIPASQNVTEMPLNKFIAHAGICGRREAAGLVKEGNIKVNNTVITEPGFKVSVNDKIVFNNKQLYLQKNLVYILLNKPKDYITTAKDEQGRKTVFDLIERATEERVYSVGRLDRNTTGVLLLTNDGELTQKLTHPSYEVKKIYEVKLDKPLQKKDIETIKKGIELEDGFIMADAIGYADTKDKSVIGIEIHSGRNRIVRRIFEYLGYDVKNLDRVLFANLTKKNVERGKWRFLNEKEVRLLKYMNQSFLKKKAE